MLCDKALCTGCCACENICPEDAISMSEDNEGFLRPAIIEDLCTHCRLCEKACPILNKSKNVANTSEPRVYACWSLDDQIREKSSSGGIFTILAKEVLQEGGVVFGAGFDENLKLKHTYIENYNDIDILRRSKYVQSDIGNSYSIARDFLKNGRSVLFVGTPCQIAGLRGFLKKTYENLLLLSFICYGVPSPKVFDKYIKYREKENKEKIKSVSFRNKQNHGWTNCDMHIEFFSGKSLDQPLRLDPYFVGFGRNLFTRESCFHCQFRYSNVYSDILLVIFGGRKS